MLGIFWMVWRIYQRWDFKSEFGVSMNAKDAREVAQKHIEVLARQHKKFDADWTRIELERAVKAATPLLDQEGS